jgi:Cu(I)/Ag(I) efflux system periplasmic protein CusF
MRTTFRIMTALGLAGASIAAIAQSTMVDGQVKKVDEAAGKITIQHGALKKFDMEDGMTMVFRANDPTMLKQVKPGDRIKFDADKINGQFTVMKIEKKK